MMTEPLPLTEETDDEGVRKSAPPPEPVRHRLTDTREGITHKFTIHGHGWDGKPKTYTGYVIVGLYRDGQPGEIFVSFAKMGGRQGALIDAWCTAVSMMLQSGHPLESITGKVKALGFEPRGFTEHATIRTCTSPLDYIARWLELKFLPAEDEDDETPNDGEEKRHDGN